MTKAMMSFFQHSNTPVLLGQGFKEILAINIAFLLAIVPYIHFWTMISIFVSAVQKKSRGPRDHGFKNAIYFLFFNLVHHHHLAWVGSSGSGIKKMPIQNRSSCSQYKPGYSRCSLL